MYALHTTFFLRVWDWPEIWLFPGPSHWVFRSLCTWAHPWDFGISALLRILASPRVWVSCPPGQLAGLLRSIYLTSLGGYLNLEFGTTEAVSMDQAWKDLWFKAFQGFRELHKP